MRTALPMTLVLFLIFALGCQVCAAPAVRYAVKVQPQEAITIDRDHYKISVLRGWVSAKDRFFKSLLSKKSKLVVSIDEQVDFFDNDHLIVSSLFENIDIEKDTNRAWGQNVNVLNNVPADANSTLTFKLVIHREDRLTQIFEGLNATKADLPADVFTSPWLGYSKAVANIFSRIFATAQPQIPFSWTGNIKLNDVMSGSGAMFSHYIVLIAPNGDHDTFPQQVDASKLAYDEVSQQLRYDGAFVPDRSYLVLKVTKSEGYNIHELILESSAPWAVLAQSQFLVIPTADATNGDQLSTLARNILTQLSNEIDLLKREHRFSKFDRAVALRSFAEHARESVVSRCSALGLTAPECPTTGLDQFIAQIGGRFELPDSFRIDLASDSDNLVREIRKSSGPRRN